MKNFLENLNTNQKAAVLHTEGAVAIIAGAGSGKTRTITKKIAYLIKNIGVLPGKILGITFTNKAANEMKERVEQELEEKIKYLTISTYHSLCARILRQEIEYFNYPSNFNIVDNLDQKQILSRIYKVYSLSPKSISYNAMIDFISKNKMRKVNVDELIDQSFSDAEKLKSRIMKDYQNELFKSKSLDFNDLLLFVEKLFSENEQVCQKWANKFDYVLVDEFQDTSYIQYKLIRVLAAKQNITIVGDPDQTIYTWRNADPHFMNNPHEFFQNVSIIKLEENYRSTKTILNAANKLIRNNANRIPKELFTNGSNGEDITFYQGFSDEDEARYVAKIISRISKSEPLKNTAVLYRANYLSQNIEKQLIHHKIKYIIFGGVKFYQRKEIKDVVAFLKVISNSESISLQRIINVPSRKIGLIALEKIFNFITQNNLDLYDALKNHLDKLKISPNQKKALKFLVENFEIAKKDLHNQKIAKILKNFLERINYSSIFNSIEDASRIENINEFLKSIDIWQVQNPEKSLDEFLSEISLYLEKDEDQKFKNSDYVSLMTIHSAKGLEFDNVFVIGLSEGVLPSGRALSENNNYNEALEEERRLTYVAITRAKKKLYLTDSKGYIFDQKNQKETSRFVKEMGVKISNTQNTFSFKSFKNMYSKEDKNFLEGDLVTHDTFGNGKILSLQGDIITINFENGHGVKSLMKNHKSLTRRVK